MSDLIERLRITGIFYWQHSSIKLEAADRIQELDKANDTLHKLMVSGESRGIAKATEEFKQKIEELETDLALTTQERDIATARVEELEALN